MKLVNSRKTTSQDDVDTTVGLNLRDCRIKKGMTQRDLASSLGITFQQVQKYESGANRISASKLWYLSKILSIDISEFYKDISSEASGTEPKPEKILAEQSATVSLGDKPDDVTNREVLDLVRAYYRIPDAKVRRGMSDLCKTLSKKQA